MRVALVTDGIYPFVVGGMQKHSYYLAKYLAAKGIAVELYHFREHNKVLNKAEIFGSVEEKIEFIELEFPRHSPRLPGHYLRESREYSRNIFNEFIKRPLPDVIICKGFTGWEFIDRKSLGYPLPKIVVNFHGYEMFQKTFSIREFLAARVLRRPVSRISLGADAVFSYGGGITGLLKEKVGVEAGRIISLPSGVERSFLADSVLPHASPLKFLFVGRNERRKGLTELNSAIKGIYKNSRNFSFSFIGEIPDTHQLRLDNCFYHGLITDKKHLRELISGCDVLVCPSWSEGMPNVILEAMASGLAIVSTDTGATSLLVNDQNGWLLSSPQPSEIEKTLLKILSMPPEDILKKRKSSLEKIKGQFLWEDVAEDLVMKLKALVNDVKS